MMHRNQFFSAYNQNNQLNTNTNQSTFALIGKVNGPFDGPYPLCENLQRHINAMITLPSGALVAGTQNGEVFLVASGVTTPLGTLTGPDESSGNRTTRIITAFSLLPNGSLAVSTSRGMIYEFQHPLLRHHLDLAAENQSNPLSHVLRVSRK